MGIKAVMASEAIKEAHDYDLVMTAPLLEQLRLKYCISIEYVLHAPRLGQHPYDLISNGFDLSCDTLKTGLNLLLYLVIESYLQW